MPDMSQNSPEHNFIFVIVPREKLRLAFENSGIPGGDLLEMQLWRHHASLFISFPRVSIAGAEQFAKALFLKWTWKSYGGDDPNCDFSRLLNELIGGLRMKVETFDELWELTTFHGFSNECQNVFRRLAAENSQTEVEIRSMISEDAAVEWIGYDRAP